MAQRGGQVDPEIREGDSSARSMWRMPLAVAGPLGIFVARVHAWRLEAGAILEREVEDGRGFLWLPVAFGVGVVLYFALPREPTLVALILLAVVLLAASFRSRRRVAAFRVLAILTTIVLGVTAMKLRTDSVEAPRLAREMTTTVSGWVVKENETPRGGVRVYLRVAMMERARAANMPKLVRVTLRTKTTTIAVGDAITVKARLRPPSGPVMPGGYDFGRAAFYEGIGAVGFAYGPPKPTKLGPAPLSLRLWRPIEELRDIIRVRIEDALPGDNGRIAAALVMGDQGGISEETQDAMRASGLGHVLSISGLHMALVAGSAFWLIRALLALSASLALNRPIKKWAAAGGLVVAAFYLGISGGGVATDRSFIMLAIMLIAVMIDRRALTLRNVAIAALVVLFFVPETVLSASFQMSFAATVALVSAYELVAVRSDRLALLADRAGFGIGRRIWSSVSALALTSLIAGLATTPFAAFHFQRMAPLSLVANLAAMPVVAILIMPAALFSVLLMPFGLEVLPLTVMDWGLDWMMVVAKKTADWSEGAGGVRAAPAATLMLFVAGFLWLTLWRERWRLAGLAPIALAVPLALSGPRPDILVAESGEAIAVRGSDGRLQVAGGKYAAFEVETWLRADADNRDAKSPEITAGVSCDSWGCIASMADERLVSLVLRPDAFAEDCLRAAVIVSRFSAPEGCRAETIVVDRERLKLRGAHALYRGPDGTFRIRTAYPEVRRPHMPTH